MQGWLPCGVSRAVEVGTGALGVDVEDVLAAEGVGVGVILVGTETPLCGASHGVDGDAAEKFDCFTLDFYAGDEGFEIGRVVEAVGFGLHTTLVGGILVGIDGGAHLPEVAAEFALFGALDLKTGYRNGGCGEDGDDGHGDDEFYEGESGLGVGTPVCKSQPLRRAQGKLWGTRIYR